MVRSSILVNLEFLTLYSLVHVVCRMLIGTKKKKRKELGSQINPEHFFAYDASPLEFLDV